MEAGAERDPDPNKVQSQTTVINLVLGEDGMYTAQPIKQKIQVGSTPYELQEIFGIDQSKLASGAADSAEASGEGGEGEGDKCASTRHLTQYVTPAPHRLPHSSPCHFAVSLCPLPFLWNPASSLVSCEVPCHFALCHSSGSVRLLLFPAKFFASFAHGFSRTFGLSRIRQLARVCHLYDGGPGHHRAALPSHVHVLRLRAPVARPVEQVPYLPHKH